MTQASSNQELPLSCSPSGHTSTSPGLDMDASEIQKLSDSSESFSPSHGALTSSELEKRREQLMTDVGSEPFTIPVWPPSSHVTEAVISHLMAFSYSCSLADYCKETNTIAIKRAPSTRRAGVFHKTKVECFGRIPACYFQGARMALRQSVYYLSFLMGLGKDRGNSLLVLAVQRLAYYHRRVFLDLVRETQKVTSDACFEDWRYDRFDMYLHRQHELGKHDPEDPEVANFQPPTVDATTYGIYGKFALSKIAFTYFSPRLEFVVPTIS
jgi:hypothetical protein